MEVNIFLIVLFILPVIQCKLKDWLINDIKFATILEYNDNNDPHKYFTLTNGIIGRSFLTDPGFTTIDYYSYEKKTSLLRALGPEAVIQLDDKDYNVGYVKVNMQRAYLNRTLLFETVQKDRESFQYVGHTVDRPEAPFPYKPMRSAPKDTIWPPQGLRLNVTFKAPNLPTIPDLHKNVTVVIHYQMYDGIPAMTKWVSISIPQSQWGKVKARFINVETLAVNQPFSKISTWDGYTEHIDGPDNAYDWMYVDTNKAHGTTVRWITDPTQSSTPGSYEPMVSVVYSDPYPIVTLNKDGFVSFQVNELLHCSNDAARVALAKHQLLRLLAPQTQENPIFFHMTNSTSSAFRSAVDQLVEVGFEMIIYSFGSGFNLESTNQTYIDGIKEDIKYANSKGIEVGGYDLIVLDRGNLPMKYRTIDSDGKPGGNACLASAWYDVIYDRIFEFIKEANMTMFETDGPYGGGTCYSTTHAHHEGFQDSVYQQVDLQEKIYKELRAKNIFINAPDLYHYAGSNKIGLGYNENQYSLPRWEDLSVSRQTIFDRIYSLTPTAGWMFLPLVDYHGGGDAAAFEPLSKHLKEYNFALAQYLGAGVAACYRGYRIFDTDTTKILVKEWVLFYKKYRSILTSDIVRITRPDMQGIDAYIHVNYKLKNKGLVMVFNPTLTRQSVKLTLPLYYTGLKYKAAISEQEKGFIEYELDVGHHGWEVDVPVELDPLEVTWFVVKSSNNSEIKETKKNVKMRGKEYVEIIESEDLQEKLNKPIVL